MRIGLRILLSDIVPASNDITWGDIIDNWEAYAREWNASNALSVTQSEAPILDMFGDESISIKRMVKDLSDPKKLFTDYSRSFTVPASKKNNMIFQHYYNVEIQNGLDTRQLLPCRLLLNNTTFQVGNINVEGVKMADGVPTAYKLRFIGKLSELAKRIGQDELSSLELGQYDIEDFNAKQQFTAPAANDLVFPLASRSSQFTIDSGNASLGIDNVKNIRFTGSTAYFPDYGIGERDIVGAFKVGTLLDLIESKYGVNFTGVFQRDYIRFMYMWLHKASKDRNKEGYSAQPDSFTPTTPPANSNGGIVINSNSVAINNVYDPYGYGIYAIGTWTGGGSIHLLKDGQEVASSNQSGVQTQYQWVTNNNTTGQFGTPGIFTVEIRTATTQTASVSIAVDEFEYTIPQGEIRPEYVYLNTYTYTDASVDIGDYQKYYIREWLPKMKVMDFLSSLFKMFNVIAEVDESNNISTKHFDAYMSEGVVYDVTQYVDQSNYDVDKPNLYSAIRYKFADPKTALELAYKQVNSKDYGELGYQLTSTDGFRLSGSEYKLEVANQRIPVERMFNINQAVQQYINVGYTNFADLKGAEQDTKPAFTYIASMYNHVELAWTDGLTTSPVSNYAIPCSIFNNNTLPNTVIEGQVGLFFGEENNEYQLTKLVPGFGLFNNFYKGSTALLFDEQTRRVSFRAEIPQRILLNLKLSDVLYISGKFYQINSIETNYLSGWSQLDLTLTGRSKLDFFKKQTYNVQNTGATDLRVTFINHNGFIAVQTISPGNTDQVNCVGEICTFSNIYYNATLA